MKTTFASIKRQEAQKRMAALKQLRDGTRTAAEGGGSKWEITNFSQVLTAMAERQTAR